MACRSFFSGVSEIKEKEKSDYFTLPELSGPEWKTAPGNDLSVHYLHPLGIMPTFHREDEKEDF